MLVRIPRRQNTMTKTITCKMPPGQILVKHIELERILKKSNLPKSNQPSEDNNKERFVFNKKCLQIIIVFPVKIILVLNKTRVYKNINFIFASDLKPYE